MSAEAFRGNRRGQRGMVTAELAVATLAALAVLLLLSWGIYLMVMQVRCIDTAAEVARQAARGDDAAVARARREAPAGARIHINRTEALVRVEVRVVARPLATNLAAVPLRADAEVVPEPEEPR
jgi:hypothetical protein